MLVPPFMLGHHLIFQLGPVVFAERFVDCSHQIESLGGECFAAFRQRQYKLLFGYVLFDGVNHHSRLFKELSLRGFFKALSGVEGAAWCRPENAAGKSSFCEDKFEEQNALLFVDDEKAGSWSLAHF